MTEYKGLIRLHDEEGDRVRKVGKLKAYRVNAELANDRGQDLFEVFDCHSQGLTDLFEQLYDGRENFYKEPIASRYELVDADCLIIDYIAIHPRVRGRGVGLLAMLKTIDMLRHGCGLTVCLPLPLSVHAPELLKLPSSWGRFTRKNRPRRLGRSLRPTLRSWGFVELMARSIPYYYSGPNTNW